MRSAEAPPAHVRAAVRACRASLVHYLNDLVALDPMALAALADFAVPCGRALADHPRARTRPGRDGPEVGLLGLLDGFLAVAGDARPWLGVKLGADGLRFELVTSGPLDS